jgi:hypothetical protein
MLLLFGNLYTILNFLFGFRANCTRVTVANNVSTLFSLWFIVASQGVSICLTHCNLLRAGAGRSNCSPPQLTDHLVKPLPHHELCRTLNHGWDLAKCGWDLADCGWDPTKHGLHPQ